MTEHNFEQVRRTNSSIVHEENVQFANENNGIEMSESEIRRRLLQVVMRQKGNAGLARHGEMDIGRRENGRQIFNEARPPPIPRTQPNPHSLMQSGHQIHQRKNCSQNDAINHRPNGFEDPVPNPGLIFDGMMAQAIRSLGGFSYTMTLNTIPNLDGSKGSDSVNAFFKQFDMATEEWPESKRLRALRSKCFGKAERAFNFAVAENRHDYQLIRRAIIRQLDDADAKQITAFDQLMNGVWLRPNESIDQLGERVSRLVRCVFPGLTEQLYDEYSAMHFIRALPNSELATTLEMTRKPGATFDEFIAQATRAEAVQNAARNSWRSSQNNDCFQNKRRHIVCYNCGRVGHTSRNCYSQPKQQTHQDNSPSNNFQSSPSFRNQNFHFQQNDESPKRGNLFIGAVNLEHRPEIEKFFGNTTNKSEKCGFMEENPAVGKILAAKVSVFGRKLDAMLDGGSQISLISAKFFLQIMDKVSQKDVVARSESRIIDINGKEVNCYGVVSLPIRRGPLEAKINLFVAKSTFGYDLLFGTNALNQLGFQMFDAVNNNIVHFAPASPENSPLIVFKTFVSHPHDNIGANRKDSIDSQIVADGQNLGKTPRNFVGKKKEKKCKSHSAKGNWTKKGNKEWRQQNHPTLEKASIRNAAENLEKRKMQRLQKDGEIAWPKKRVWRRKNYGQIQLGTTENLGRGKVSPKMASSANGRLDLCDHRPDSWPQSPFHRGETDAKFGQRIFCRGGKPPKEPDRRMFKNGCWHRLNSTTTDRMPN